MNRFLSDVQLRRARSELLELRDKMAAARNLVAELTPTFNPTRRNGRSATPPATRSRLTPSRLPLSRTGYLRSLRDCIGDPPDEYKTGWKEEWVALRAEQYLRFTEGLAESSKSPPPARPRVSSGTEPSTTSLQERSLRERSSQRREERGTKEWVERHKPLPKVLQRFDSAIQESVASGMEREHAETYHALQSVKGALGAAMREGRKDFACSTYALCDALHATFRKQQQDWQQKQAVRAAVEGDSDGPFADSVLPPLLYTNLEGKYGLQEGDARWRNLRAPDEAGFRGLLSETLVRANDRVDCFSEEGYRVYADGARSNGRRPRRAGRSRRPLSGLSCRRVCGGGRPDCVLRGSGEQFAGRPFARHHQADHGREAPPLSPLHPLPQGHVCGVACLGGLASLGQLRPDRREAGGGERASARPLLVGVGVGRQAVVVLRAAGAALSPGKPLTAAADLGRFPAQHALPAQGDQARGQLARAGRRDEARRRPPRRNGDLQGAEHGGSTDEAVREPPSPRDCPSLGAERGEH